MKRQSSENLSLVYAYGCGEILSGLEYAYAEQAKNHRLWDALVDIDRMHDVSILAAASADDDRLVYLRDEIHFASQAVSEAIEARAKERKRVQGNAVPSVFDEAVSNSSTRHKTARTEFFHRLSEWRKAHPDAIKEFSSRRFASIKDARNASGLYWANYNRVIQSFDAARTLCRKIGRRLHYSDKERSSGCLTIQVQRTRSGLGAAPQELQNGTFNPLQIDAVPDTAYDPAIPRGQRSRASQTTLTLRVDNEGHTIKARMWMHRPLPANCRVKMAQLTWRDGGARGRQWQLALTISMPRAPIAHPHANDAVGIDVGWRMKPDGSLRVAYWHGSDGAHEELVLPATMMAHMDWAERTRSEIDSEKIVGEQEIRRAELRVKGARSKDLGQRRELYRLSARKIAMRYGIVGVENLDLAGMAMKRENDAHAGRTQRQRAAVHSLLQEIKHQCAKHGSRHVPLDGPSTMQCHECGKVGEPTDRAALYWTCDGCGSVHDQDHNAAINLMLSAAQDASGEVMSGTPARENKVLPAPVRHPKRSARKSPAGINGINDLP